MASPSAWSLTPDRFAFDAVSGDGTRRFRVVLALWPSGLVVSDVFEVSEDPAGRVLALGLASSTRRRRLSSCSLTFAVVEGKRGAEALMSAEFRGSRDVVGLVDPTWRGTFGRWLKECAAVLKGRRLLPAYGLPPALHAACMARRGASKAGEAVTVASSVLISAPPQDVWPLVYDPAASLVTEPGTVAAGNVPGTPTREAGEVQYHIHGRPGGTLHASLIAVDEYEENRSALAHFTVSSESSWETRYLAEPDGAGTRLTITTWVLQDGAAGHREQTEKSLAESVARYKTVIKSRQRN